MTSEAATLRFAEAADVAAILELWRAAETHPTITDSAAAVTALIAFDPQAVIVAEREGQIVGSVFAGWNGWRGSLYRLAVHPGMQRRGIASALARHAVETLRSRGAARIDAFVVAADGDAVAFWDSLAELGVRRDPLPKMRFVTERQ
jgi:ribosomal protein S18 acetylase RimI-like enzyme